MLGQEGVVSESETRQRCPGCGKYVSTEEGYSYADADALPRVYCDEECAGQPPRAQIIDLFEALKKSLEES